MEETWVYRLRPRSSFHFGPAGRGAAVSEAMFHSDSLFGALATGIAAWDGEAVLRDMLSQFLADPPFRISSLFPCAGEVLLFPKPLLPQLTQAEFVDKAAVRVSRVRLVSQGILEALARGQPVDAHMERENLCQNGTVWLTRDEKSVLPPDTSHGRLWHSDAVSGSAVDRIVPASRPYWLGRTTFSPACGLYFLLQVREPASRDLIERALDYLSDAGLGGRRSSGHGQFSVESATQLSPFWPSDGDSFLTLSLYHPTRGELQAGVLAGQATYEIARRQNWIGSAERAGQRSTSVSFVVEGSLLRSTGQAAYGDLVDVTPGAQPPSHPVYRYGYAFPVTVSTEGDSHEP